MNRPRKEVNLKECIELYKKGLSMNKIAKLNNVSASVIKLRLKEKGII
jgi:predicted HTH domain antitoxin